VSYKLESEVLSRLRTAIDEYKKKGQITKEDLRLRLFQEAAVLEQDRWRIVGDLRARAPESERDLAREVADFMESELHKESVSDSH